VRQHQLPGFEPRQTRLCIAPQTHSYDDKGVALLRPIGPGEPLWPELLQSAAEAKGQPQVGTYNARMQHRRDVRRDGWAAPMCRSNIALIIYHQP
jgi:hypothetical protein